MTDEEQSARTWTNPRPKQNYKLMILGSGKAAHALCEEALRYGVDMAWVSSEVSDEDASAAFASKGVDCFLGTPSFVSTDCLELDGQAISFDRAILVPSLTWYLPKVSGVVQKHVLTPDCIKDDSVLPENITISGSGPSACALAQQLTFKGLKVRVLSDDGEILHGFPVDAACLIRETLEKAGVEFVLGAELCAVEFPDAQNTTLFTKKAGQETEYKTERLICAETPFLKFPASEIKAADLSLRGQELIIDDHWRTTNPKIYALNHVRLYTQQEEWSLGQIHALLENVFIRRKHRVGEFPVPLRVPTHPSLFVLGDASGRGTDSDDIKILRQDYHKHADVFSENDETGFVELEVDVQSGHCLNAILVGRYSEELIGQFCFLMQNGKPITHLLDSDYAQPGYGAVLRSLAYQLEPQRDVWGQVKNIMTRIPGR